MAALVLEVVLPEMLAGPRALIAKMWSGIVKYRMPFTSSGVDLIVGLPTPRCGSDRVIRYIHSIFSKSTLDWLIWSRSLKRRPE